MPFSASDPHGVGLLLRVASARQWECSGTPTGHFDPSFGGSFVAREVAKSSLLCFVLVPLRQLHSAANLHSTSFVQPASLCLPLSSFCSVSISIDIYRLSHVPRSASPIFRLLSRTNSGRATTDTHSLTLFLLYYICILFTPPLHLPLTHHRRPQFSSFLPLLSDRKA